MDPASVTAEIIAIEEEMEILAERLALLRQNTKPYYLRDLIGIAKDLPDISYQEIQASHLTFDDSWLDED